MALSRSGLLALGALVLAAFVPETARGALPTQPSATFGPSRTTTLGLGVTDPRAVTAGDLDGDGRPDLVVVSDNGTDGRLTVLRNAGSGAFGLPPGSPRTVIAGAGVSNVALGDLNGDGRPDAAVTTATGAVDDGVVTLLGDGTGRLEDNPFGVFTTRPFPRAVAIGDLDGDLDAEVVTASEVGMTNSQLTVLANNGLGDLTTIAAYGAAATSNAVGLTLARLDGDARLDALVISRNAGSGSAWLARGTSGMGFMPESTPIPVGPDPAAVTTGDLDGDGDVDGLVADGSTDVLHVLENQGGGAFTVAPHEVRDASAMSGLALSDLDGDGDLDVVVSDRSRSAIGMLRNDGDGDLEPATWLSMGSGARSPVVTDLSGDAVPDLVTADSGNASVSVRLGTSVPVPEATGPGDFGSVAPGSTGAARAVTLTNAGAALLRVRAARVAGPAGDDFLLTHDGCSGREVRAGGTASCAVHVRFAPSAAGTRSATLRLEHAGGVVDVPLQGTGAAAPAGAPADEPAPPAPTAPTAVTAPPAAQPEPPAKAKAKRRKLVLELLTRAVRAKAGRAAAVRYSLGSDAHLTLRVKQRGRTVAVVRARRRDGEGTLRWTARFWKRPAPAGTYVVHLRAVAEDGRVAVAKGRLTVR